MALRGRGRIRFRVCLSNFQLALSTCDLNNKILKIADFKLDLAKYRIFHLTKWIVVEKKEEREEKKEKKGVKFQEHSKLLFYYRTDYPEFLKAKQVEIRVILDLVSKLSKLSFEGKLDFLQLIDANKNSIHLDLFPSLLETPIPRLNCSFVSEMYQECVLQLLFQGIHTTSSFVIPSEIGRHANSFWFSPEFSIQIWYISPERMTFLLNAQRQNSKWNSLPPCHINDTTDVLKQAHIFLEFAYNDLPFAYSLLPFLQKYQVGKSSYQYRVPLLYYYNENENQNQTTNSVKTQVEVKFEVKNGPLFWFEEQEAKKDLFSLDESQKKLLQEYFYLGFSKEWIKKQ